MSLVLAEVEKNIKSVVVNKTLDRGGEFYVS